LAGDIYNRLPESLSRAVNKYYPNGGRPRIAPEMSKHNPNHRKDRNKQICKDRTQGFSLRDIAQKHNLCLSSIKKILKENGLTAKKERLNIAEEIKMLRKAGYNKKEIAKKLDVSRPTIYEHMKRAGIK